MVHFKNSHRFQTPASYQIATHAKPGFTSKNLPTGTLHDTNGRALVEQFQPYLNTKSNRHIRLSRPYVKKNVTTFTIGVAGKKASSWNSTPVDVFNTDRKRTGTAVAAGVAGLGLLMLLV